MLELPDVTLLCADTANHALALRALERSCSGIRFGRVALLTDALPQGVAAPANIGIVPIAPLRSRDDYSRLMLKSLAGYVTTSHALVVQWDGYVVNPQAWALAFLDVDYVGARWFRFGDGHAVGNGGFSLRSRRLIDALQDSRLELVEAEDLTRHTPRAADRVALGPERDRFRLRLTDTLRAQAYTAERGCSALPG